MSILIKGMEMPKTGVYVLSVDNTGKDKTIFTIAEHTHSGKIIPRHVGEAVPVPPHGQFDAESSAWLKRKSMIYCSECCESFDAIFVNDFKYCPNCGLPKKGA